MKSQQRMKTPEAIGAVVAMACASSKVSFDVLSSGDLAVAARTLENDLEMQNVLFEASKSMGLTEEEARAMRQTLGKLMASTTLLLATVEDIVAAGCDHDQMMRGRAYAVIV